MAGVTRHARELPLVACNLVFLPSAQMMTFELRLVSWQLFLLLSARRGANFFATFGFWNEVLAQPPRQRLKVSGALLAVLHVVMCHMSRSQAAMTTAHHITIRSYRRLCLQSLHLFLCSCFSLFRIDASVTSLQPAHKVSILQVEFWLSLLPGILRKPINFDTLNQTKCVLF